MAKLARRRENQTDRRFESISLVYLAFFVLGVLSPSLITHDYFGFSQTFLEEVMIFITGLASLLTFTVYERMIETRIKERDVAEESAERAKRELVESYKYIGSMNRQMEVLKKLTNETSMSLVTNAGYWKDLLHSLAQNAASCADAKQVVIRFVDLDKLRTEKEIYFQQSNTKAVSVPNREIRKLAESGESHLFAATDSGEVVLVVSSDRKDSRLKAHFILSVEPDRITDMEISLVKVLANQAELVYHHLRNPKNGSSPLELLDAATSESIGEVS